MPSCRPALKRRRGSERTPGGRLRSNGCITGVGSSSAECSAEPIEYLWLFDEEGVIDAGD